MYPYLTADDWYAFRQQWPRAEAFLLDRALRGELASLRRLKGPTPWQATRIQELAILFTELDGRTMLTLDLDPDVLNAS